MLLKPTVLNRMRNLGNTSMGQKKHCFENYIVNSAVKLNLLCEDSTAVIFTVLTDFYILSAGNFEC